MNSINMSVAVQQLELEKQKVLDNQNKVMDGIRINNLSKTYFKRKCCVPKKFKKALKHVYLEIPLGELCCILGHNGAGKTTLINILIGILSF